MANFDFYLNRQGVRGPQGETGPQGFSPIITVATDTLSEYILQIQTQNNTFQTANLREHKDDLGGTYIRYNRDTGVMYAGDADIASQSQMGIVRFATATDIEREASDCVVAPADVVDMIEARDYDEAIEAVDDKADANADNIATNTDNISTLQGQMTGVLGNYVTTDTEQFISGRKKFRNIIAIDNGVVNSARNDDKTWLYNNNTRTVIGHNANTTSLVGSEVDIRTSSQDINITRQGGQYTNIDTGNISNYVPDMNNYYNTNQIDLMLNEKADISDIPTVGNGTITFTQGGVTKGTITTNQSGDATIALDAGGGGGQYVLPPATTSTLGGVIPDGSTITVDADGTIHSVGGGGTPANMVTTDTAQTITGTKTFSQSLTIGERLTLTGSYIVIANNFGNRFVAVDGTNNIVTVGESTFNLALQGSDVSIIKNNQTYTNIDSGNVGTYALTSSNISTDTYIQALVARIAALEANINGGNA